MKTFWILSAILLLHEACPPLSKKRERKQVYFPNLKTTYNDDPLKGYKDEPRTISEAEKAGFELIASGCKEGINKHPLPGKHYTQRLNKTTGRGGEIILIFDVNGFIAGMTSVTPKKSTNNPDPALFQHSTFQILRGLNCTEIYGSTVYFIPPSRVCKGRTDEEFKEQGTGTGLYIVNGTTADEIITIPFVEPKDKPSNQKRKQKKRILYRAECTIFMGTRYLLHDPREKTSVQSDCGDAPAIEVLYHAKRRELNGFAFRTPVSPPGKRWEKHPAWSLKYMYGEKEPFPQCYKDLAEEGAESMHVYLGPFRQFCPGSQQYNDPSND